MLSLYIYINLKPSQKCNFNSMAKYISIFENCVLFCINKKVKLGIIYLGEKFCLGILARRKKKTNQHINF